MKLGFVSAILPERSLDEVLAFACAEKFSTVEVMCRPVGRAERKFAGVTHVDVTDFSAARAGEVKALCAKHGVSISALGYYPNPLDPDEAAARVCVKHLRRVIAAARTLGLRRPRVHRGGGRHLRQNPRGPEVRAASGAQCPRAFLWLMTARW
jgi:sugar phosphate isomerase/epimerase